MKLEYSDIHSATWKKIKDHCEEKIQSLRMRNDGMLDELTTANIRGQIKALKEISALEEAQILVTDD